MTEILFKQFKIELFLEMNVQTFKINRLEYQYSLDKKSDVFLNISIGCLQGQSYFKKTTSPALNSQTKIRPSAIVAIPHGHFNLVTVFPIK